MHNFLFFKSLHKSKIECRALTFYRVFMHCGIRGSEASCVMLGYCLKDKKKKKKGEKFNALIENLNVSVKSRQWCCFVFLNQNSTTAMSDEE